MVERKGRVRAFTVENARRTTLLPIVTEHVLPATTVFTDEMRSYDLLGRYGYRHERIQHSERVYVSGNVHTNTVEGFFGNVKRGISGNYHSVSRKWLQGYLNEYACGTTTATTRWRCSRPCSSARRLIPRRTFRGPLASLGSGVGLELRLGGAAQRSVVLPALRDGALRALRRCLLGYGLALVAHVVGG